MCGGRCGSVVESRKHLFEHWKFIVARLVRDNSGWPPGSSGLVGGSPDACRHMLATCVLRAPPLPQLVAEEHPLWQGRPSGRPRYTPLIHRRREFSPTALMKAASNLSLLVALEAPRRARSASVRGSSVSCVSQEFGMSMPPESRASPYPSSTLDAVSATLP
ncbi:hypothetical protein Hamer_G003602 [Homarus americanus]|uniref:Uncharacterized protein n=1 Tax=Homarus americanus TaxID=6706 RepID=A0A8J5K3U4_HOMAM|nr:hypothetical protein Hamer_G003602 [Homarus americanus]